jgi:hypothetical protein
MSKNKFTRAGIHAVLTAAGTDTGKARALTDRVIEADRRPCRGENSGTPGLRNF